MTAKNLSKILLGISFSWPLISLLIGQLVDQSSLQKDAFGRNIWVNTSNVSGQFNQVIFFIMAAISVFLIIFGNHTKQPSKFSLLTYSVLAFMATIILSITWNYDYWSLEDFLKLLIFVIVIIAIGKNGINYHSIKLLRNLSIVSIITIAVFYLFFPELSTTACRLDKCNNAGFLLKSFFPHENYLALFLLSIIPFLFLAKLRFFLITTSLILIYLSGARVALVASIVIIVLTIFSRQRSKATAVQIFPLLALFASLFVFVFAGLGALTGRGTIYSSLRLALDGRWIGGLGPNALTNFFESGQLGSFLPGHEHGQVPYIIVNFGLFSFLLFAATIVFRILANRTFPNTYPIFLTLPFIGLSTVFVTESPVSFEINSPFVWVYALMFSFFTTSESLEFVPDKQKKPNQFFQGYLP